MSHVEAITTAITDLQALEAAAKDLGAVWHAGQKKYHWYGKHVGDYPLPPGFQAKDLGKCEHAISLPGVKYQIGVAKNPLAPGKFTLLYDFYGSGGTHDGGLLKKHFGDGLSKLVDHYNHHVVKRSLKFGQQAILINSDAAAARVSKLTGQHVTYNGQLLTAVVSA